MHPEFPPGFNPNDLTIIRIQDRTWTCGMLRGEYACGNETNYIGVPHRKDSRFETIAICDTCRDELRMTGETITAYWREQQREWGVR